MPERHLRILASAIVTVVVWVSALTCYNITRPRLVKPLETIWRRAITTPTGPTTDSEDDIHLSGRAQAIAIREFLLEHAQASDTRLEFDLSYALCGTPTPNWNAVAETFGSAALKVARSLSREPTLKDFEYAGMRLDQPQYRATGYPKPFLSTDIEQRRSPDIILGFPNRSDGVCIMLRKSGANWESIPLSLGEVLEGMWEIHIGKAKRPLIASLYGTLNEFDTHQRLVLWIWQDSRIVRVLTVPLYGDQNWSIELLSDAAKSTLIHGRAASWQPSAEPTQKFVFRWNGRSFVPPVQSKAQAVQNDIVTDRSKGHSANGRYSRFDSTAQDIAEGIDQAEEKIFAQHNYAQALEDLRDLEAVCEKVQMDREDQSDWMAEIGYCEAVCFRRTGNSRSAENRLTSLICLPDDNAWRKLAGLWLK